MEKTLCARCGDPLEPGERRVSFFNKDENNNTYDRGAFHLKHLFGESDD